MSSVRPYRVPNSLSAMSSTLAAGMPTKMISNTSTRNMQSKVQKKMLLGGTEEDYDKFAVVRYMRESQRKDQDGGQESQMRESSPNMNTGRKKKQIQGN